MSHIMAFAPLYLRDLGAAPSEIPVWTGALAAGSFVVGLPLVPFWGVWAEKYGRRAVIARSAYVEALVLLFVAVSHSPIELTVSRLLSGFQLGNTGVMYAALSSVAPRHRVGLALSLVGMGSALGFAAGPALGGLIADTVGLRTLYLGDATLSLLSGLSITLGFREARTWRPRGGSAWRLAWSAVAGTVRLPVTRMVFLGYVFAYTARQMVSPFLPLLVQDLYAGENVATAIGLVVGGTALAGALVAPLAGALGDRLGYARVLAWGMAGGVAGAVGLTLAPTLWAVAAASLLFVAGIGTATAMSVALLATTTPEEHRSPTLNLALLPLYLGGIAGPAVAAGLAALGLRAAFLGAAAPLAAGVPLARALRRFTVARGR